MAFENPFLKPSATRQSALKYLFSDEPAGDTFVNTGSSSSASVVADAFGVSGLQDEAVTNALNIANNGGEYNPNDTTDYSAKALSNPIEALNAFNDYGSKAISLLGFFGLPFAGSISAGIKQDLANNVMGLINNLVAPHGGEVAEGKSPIAAGLSSMLPFGIGDKIGNDNVKAAVSLAEQFGTTGALVGYYTAGLDPMIGQITDGMIEDKTSITPAQYGTIGQAVSERIQSNIQSGMDLNASQAEAVNFFNPNATIATPVTETPLATPTEIAPNFPPSFTKTGTGLIYADPSAVGPQLPNEYIPGLFTSTPVPEPVAPTPSESTTPTTSPTGGYVVDGSGNIVTSGDGTAVTWGTGAPSYTPPAPVVEYNPPTPTFDWNSGDSSGSGSSGDGSGYSSSSDGGWGSSETGEW